MTFERRSEDTITCRSRNRIPKGHDTICRKDENYYKRRSR